MDHVGGNHVHAGDGRGVHTVDRHRIHRPARRHHAVGAEEVIKPRDPRVVAQVSEIGIINAAAFDHQVRNRSENPAFQLGVEAIHHADHHRQHQHTQRQAGHRYPGNERRKLTPAGRQITQRNPPGRRGRALH